MSVVIGIIIGILMLMFLVTAHEFGHFILARRNGVEVEEFGICFPPRAVAWRKVNGKWRRLKKSEWKNPPGKGTILSLNWLPIGGFCQMKGESDADTAKGSFGAARFWSKTKILFGGVAMNWLVAFVILTILAWIGMPHFLDGQFRMPGDTRTIVEKPVTIGEVIGSSPASAAGLKEKDVIKLARAVDNNPERTEIVSTEDLLEFNKRHAGGLVYLTYERDGSEMIAEVQLNKADSTYLLGASISGSTYYMSSWSAPIVGLATTAQITGETFKGVGVLLYNLVSGVIQQISPSQEVRESGAEAIKSAGDSVSGPVGIIGILFPAFAASGLNNLGFLVALISISLACMNVLPIPALDGGRWLLIAIYRLRKKKLTKAKEEKIVGRAFMVILILAAIVTIIDILRLF
ncbi:site-2 protease family protein [Candidatus Saccharibacteria bacterium]|nr:site-2 protease family protein [Candidatus Saccharibacteria bacterium]